LPRVLGVATAIALVVGGTIGTGVFQKPRIVAQSLGSFDWAILAWIVCGILAFFGTMALAELAALFPHAGGNYFYLKKGFGPVYGFLWGWIEFWVMRTGSIAALAWLAAKAILSGFLLQDAGPWQLLWVSLGIVLFLTLINVVGVRWGGLFQNVTTWLKIGTLIVIALLPFVLGEAQPRLLTQSFAPIETSRIAGFAAAMLAILWAYKGWADLGSLAEDIKEPQRNLPRAFGYGIAIIMLLYVAANIAYSLILSQQEMAQLPEGQIVAAHYMATLFASWGTQASAWTERILSLAIAISALGAMNASLLVGPRNYFALARDGLFPRRLCETAGAAKTPLISILIQSLWTGALLYGAYLARVNLKEFRTEDPFDTLTNYVMFGAIIFETMAVAAVFRLRRLAPDLPRPFRSWGYPWGPALHILAMLFVLEETLRQQAWQKSVLGLGFIALGWLVYLTGRQAGWIRFRSDLNSRVDPSAAAR
jgi:APA family basic amino acid/polyamine antiporter